MYFLLFAIGFCAAYIFLYFLFGLFFKNKIIPLNPNAWRSILLILLFHSLVQIGIWSIPDPEWSNRFQHAIGGGFLSFIICFVVAKDSKIRIQPLQFLVWSFLVVTALGVANEMVEFFLQTTTPLVFTTGLEDTWLDLLSNWVGVLLAAGCLMPLLKKITTKRSRSRT